VSRRFQIVLPDPVAADLEDVAARAGEPPSTLAAAMVRAALSDAASVSGRVSAFRRPTSRSDRRVSPHWLEPYAGDAEWRRQMWGAIAALHARYPRLLEAMKDGWWEDEADTEMLCALAVWRGELDDGAETVREELAFQRELSEYARALNQRSGGVSSAWEPGAPPAAWLGASRTPAP
jgi:hypothetical protein